MRPKKLGLQNFIRLIDEIYSFRFQKDTASMKQLHGANQIEKPFEYTIFDFLNQKFKSKKQLDQNAIDLIASMESRFQSEEVNLFYDFFTNKRQLRELMFFLYIRSLVEKELNLMITRLNNSTDSRSIKISLQKCLKIVKTYLQNSADEDTTTQDIET